MLQYYIAWYTTLTSIAKILRSITDMLAAVLNNLNSLMQSSTGLHVHTDMTRHMVHTGGGLQ